jgi:hypothetical protein
MIGDRYEAMDLFALLPQWQLAFEPELAELDRRWPTTCCSRWSRPSWRGAIPRALERAGWGLRSR